MAGTFFPWTLLRARDVPPGLRGGVQLFFLLYFLMTGVHAVHLCAGIVVSALFAFALQRDHARFANRERVELGALYWHFVDVVWIFLYPMLYLWGVHGRCHGDRHVGDIDGVERWRLRISQVIPHTLGVDWPVTGRRGGQQHALNLAPCAPTALPQRRKKSYTAWNHFRSKATHLKNLHYRFIAEGRIFRE